MNAATTYAPAALAAQARAMLRAFKRTLPAAVRRTVQPEGWAVIVTNSGAVLASYFRDEYGQHQITEFL